MVDPMIMGFLIILFLVVVLVIIALMVGKTPVITEFEARQRGIPVKKRSDEEIERARKRSDATTKIALEIFIALAFLLVIAALAIHGSQSELLIFMMPAVVAVGILFLFAMIWLDEQKAKAKYDHIRIER